MGSVSWSWKHLKDESLYGSRAYETDNDFSSEKEAKMPLIPTSQRRSAKNAEAKT